MSDFMEDLLTAKEYAELIGSSPQIVSRLARKGRIPGARKIGRDWLFPADARPIPASKGPQADWEKTSYPPESREI